MINEASLVAEQKVKEEFPDLPEHMIISSKGLF
jgi:division protein CdvB (Snf7/Vps24/ESCRT-III family)